MNRYLQVSWRRRENNAGRGMEVCKNKAHSRICQVTGSQITLGSDPVVGPSILQAERSHEPLIRA